MVPVGVATDNSDGQSLKPWQFQKGVSPNPGGRSKIQRRVQEIIDGAADGAAQELLRICTEGLTERDRLSAVKLVLEYAIGKPKERDDDGNEIANPIAQALIELGKKT